MYDNEIITLNENDLEKIELYVHNISLRVGEIIRDKRKKLKLTIAELAKRSRVSSTVITDLENGRSLPRTEVLLKLAYSIDLRFEILFKAFAPTSTFRFSRYSEGKSLSILEMIKMDGLGSIDAKEVLEFIEFKKYKNSKRK